MQEAPMDSTTHYRLRWNVVHCFGAVLMAVIIACPAQAQVTLRVSVPASTPDGHQVHVAGNFNGWNPGDSNFILTKAADGLHEIVLPSSISGTLFFKFTLGSFEWVETNTFQESTPDRQFTASSGTPSVYTGAVEAWQYWSWPFANSTVTSSVDVLSPAFEIPQLGRTRRVMTYVPPDYESSGLRYPVLYALDAQFLFDGTIREEWGEIRVDEQLDALYAAGDPGVIVVAVEADFSVRNDEYLPFNTPGVGGGQADETLAFLTETLKPHIDATFRTLPDRANTGLFGISNGGVFATYAAMMRPDVFSRYLIFSASFCLNEQMYDFISASTPSESFLRMAFMSGEEEEIGPCSPGSFPSGQLEVISRMQGAGFNMAEVRSDVLSPSAHDLWFWEAHFTELYQWLMDGISTRTEEASEPGERHTVIHTYPNPGGPSMRLSYSGLEEGILELHDILGRKVLETSIRPGDNTIATDHLPSGIYFGRIGSDMIRWIKQ